VPPPDLCAPASNPRAEKLGRYTTNWIEAGEYVAAELWWRAPPPSHRQLDFMWEEIGVDDGR
jgi:hypothetical protein